MLYKYYHDSKQKDFTVAKDYLKAYLLLFGAGKRVVVRTYSNDGKSMRSDDGDGVANGAIVHEIYSDCLWLGGGEESFYRILPGKSLVIEFLAIGD